MIMFFFSLIREKIYYWPAKIPFWSDSDDWFDAFLPWVTRSKFDVWPNRRCKLNLGRPKLEFRLMHGTKKCRKY